LAKQRIAGLSEPDSGLFVLPDSHNRVHRKRIIELTAQYRVPAIYFLRNFATDGGLISYGPDEMELFRRTAGYVDQFSRVHARRIFQSSSQRNSSSSLI
jgi:putative ABC transport system substrate-binding protein